MGKHETTPDNEAPPRTGRGALTLLLAAPVLAVIGAVASVAAHDRATPLAATEPPALTAALPDFRALAPQARKAAFFEFLRPIATGVLAQVHLEREAVLAIGARVADGKSLSRAERALLQRLARDYEVDAGPDVAHAEVVARLGERIDTIPMSLLLVQAAKESGWGTSRFALEGNSLFGERCYSPGCGIPPAALKAPKFSVRKFASAHDSVRSYVRNLNTHPRYGEFRRLRRALRERGERLDSVRLAATLESYSERRAAYVSEVKLLVAQNDLPTRE